MKSFLAGLALLLAAAGGARADEEKVLNIYNWSDYIADDTIRNFEKETGIQVRYDTFDNNEIVHAKMVAGDTGYDIVVPSSYWAKIQADGGLLRKIDKTRLHNYGNLDPVLQGQLAQLDPGNQYMVTWLWGFTTVGINVDKVRAAIAPLPLPDNGWELLYNPRYLAKLKSCGVSFMDSATEVIPSALHYLGRPPYSHSMADYRALPPLLKSIRPYVTLFSSSGYINDLANGSICVVLGWSGDINIARQRAIAGKTGQHIEALLPSTGGILFMDTMVIPADAPHPDNALKFIDYMLRPDVAAAVSNKVFYSSPNRAARALVRPDIAGDPTIYPSDTELARMVPPDALTNETRRQMTHLFTAFKSGY